MLDKDLLIKLVREREALWDQRDKQYHNRDLRSKLWENVGNVLKIDGDEARKQWELLRDVFRKKLKESKGAEKPKWIYFEALSFLTPMMKPRATARNRPFSDTPGTQHSEEYEGEAYNTENYLHLELSTEPGEHLDGAEEVRGSNMPQPENAITPIPEDCEPQRLGLKRKQASSLQNEALDIGRRKVQSVEGGFAAPLENQEDDDLLFFKSLLPFIRKLSEIRRMKLRSTFLNCVIAELEREEESSSTWPLTPGTTQSPPGAEYDPRNPYSVLKSEI